MSPYHRIVLASRPQGKMGAEHFRMEEAVLPALKDGEVAVRNLFLSIDPYMRSRMDEVRSYAPPQAIGATMIGATAGEVIESRHPDFKSGDHVVGMLGWAEQGIAAGTALRKVDVSRIPLQAYLGAAGMPGITAWYGVKQILKPAAGETVVVSAATGAVGSIAAQLAKQAGCRVIGIAGGPEKCAHAIKDLGLDDCVDHRVPQLTERLAQSAQKGIDAVFENVGGTCLDAAIANANPHARIALCGLIAGYDGAPLALTEMRNLVSMRIRLQGFLITDHLDIWPQAIAELAGLIAAGTLRYRESIAQGLEAAPQALAGVLEGRNLGKQLVKLA